MFFSFCSGSNKIQQNKKHIIKGDPWSSECYYENPSPCEGWDVPYSYNATRYFMGSIHPRCKLPLAKRLANAGLFVSMYFFFLCVLRFQ